MRFSKMTVKEINAFLLERGDYDSFILELLEDPRQSVKKIGLSLEMKNRKLKKERQRLVGLKEIEESYRISGYDLIAGMDEVGRGPLAGPVVTCGIIMPKSSLLLHIDDSKKLSKKKREKLNREIIAECCDYAIGMVDEKVIDTINILNATKQAMVEALENFKITPDLVLLDAMTIETIIPQRSIIQGDARVYSIAAASIVAKVFRDKLMADYHEIYPQYGFKTNMGYGTAEHIRALKEYGPTPIHRKSFIGKFIG